MEGSVALKWAAAARGILITRWWAAAPPAAKALEDASAMKSAGLGKVVAGGSAPAVPVN
jgi:hypothetical protein